jgi:hypothetical protein
MNTSPQKSQFLFLLHQPGGGTPPPEQLQKIMAQFDQWMDHMKARGAVLGTNGLGPQGRVLRGPRGASFTDGPYAEGKEIVGGYVLIEAADFEQAVELARECPGLGYGLALEVRPVIGCRG